MAIKISTGLRNHMLSGGSLKSALDGGKIVLYAGAVPATADDAVGTAVPLCFITLDGSGGGIRFSDAATSGTLIKDPVQTWCGEAIASGRATFYRFVSQGDAGELSAVAPRIQGGVSEVGSDINLSSADLVAGASQTIDSYSVFLPAA